MDGWVWSTCRADGGAGGWGARCSCSLSGGWGLGQQRGGSEPTERLQGSVWMHDGGMEEGGDVAWLCACMLGGGLCMCVNQRSLQETLLNTLQCSSQAPGCQMITTGLHTRPPTHKPTLERSRFAFSAVTDALTHTVILHPAGRQTGHGRHFTTSPIFMMAMAHDMSSASLHLEGREVRRRIALVRPCMAQFVAWQP